MTEEEVDENPQCPRCGSKDIKIKAHTMLTEAGKRVFRTFLCKACGYNRALL